MKKEIRKKFLLAAMAFSLAWVAMANFIHALGDFLVELGPQQLPYSILAVSGMVLLLSILSVIASRYVKTDKIIGGTVLFFIVNYVVLTFIPPDLPQHTFYFFVITSFIFWMQESLLTQFVSSIFTPLQSKSFLPFVFGYMNLGLIVGALFVEPYRLLHESVRIGVLPIIGLIVVLILILMLGRVYHHELMETMSDMKKVSLLSDIKESFGFLSGKSRLYVALMVGIVLFIGLHITVDFKLKVVLAETFGHEVLTETLAFAFLLRSLLAWLTSVLLVKKLLFRFGVSNIMIFFPVSLVLSSVIAVIFQLHYLAVIGLFLVFSISYFSYYDICMSQMLSLVPKKLEHAVHFLVHGILYALGMIGFSAILLIYTNNIELEPLVNTGIILVASMVLVFLFVRVKQYYFVELKKDLRSEDEFLQMRAIDLFADASSIKHGEDYLRRMLELTNLNSRVRKRLIGSLGAIGNYQTIVDLTKTLLNVDDPRIKLEAIHAINQIIKGTEDLKKVPVTKHYLLRTYESILLGDVPSYVKSEVISALKFFDLEDVMSFLELHLDDKNVQIRQNVLKTLATFKDRGIIPYLEPFLQNENLILQREAIIGLWQFEDMRVKVLPRLTALYASKKTDAIENALTVIGEIGATWDKGYVHDQLENGDDHIRLHALVTLIELGDAEHTELFTQKLLGYVQQDDKQELEFALSHYRNFADSVRNNVVKLIQEMSDEESSALLQAFRDSKFVFSTEIASLSAS